MWSRREARPAPFERSIRATAADPASHLGVGTIDGSVVGFAAVTITDLHDGATIGELHDLYVMSAAGVGVGEALMDAAIDWCRDRGCIGIDSIALPGDRATKNFFETFGLVARAPPGAPGAVSQRPFHTGSRFSMKARGPSA
ncbi:MAG: GNAT family N-acetyltransferase [Acidimicrobiales bacterium]